MKKLICAVICAVVMVFGTMAISYADERDDIRARISSAKQNIQRGIQQGTITKHESAKLHNELDGILNKINRMKQGGLNHRERDQINRDLDRLDRDIYRDKHDGDTRQNRGGMGR